MCPASNTSCWLIGVEGRRAALSVRLAQGYIKQTGHTSCLILSSITVLSTPDSQPLPKTFSTIQLFRSWGGGSHDTLQGDFCHPIVGVCLLWGGKRGLLSFKHFHLISVAPLFLFCFWHDKKKGFSNRNSKGLWLKIIKGGLLTIFRSPLNLMCPLSRLLVAACLEETETVTFFRWVQNESWVPLKKSQSHC